MSKDHCNPYALERIEGALLYRTEFSGEQRDDEQQDDDRDTHCGSHTGLAFVSILCLHVGELGDNPEIGVVCVGSDHRTSTNRQYHQHLCNRRDRKSVV